MRPAYPPGYNEEPPEDGLVEHEIAIGVCYDCEEVIGPKHSEDVGYDLHYNHGVDRHETEVVATWTVTEIIEEPFFETE